MASYIVCAWRMSHIPHEMSAAEPLLQMKAMDTSEGNLRRL